VLKTGDDGFDDGRFRSLMNQLGPGVLGFAGGLAAGDAGGAAVVESEQIPFVNTPTAEQMKQVSTVFDINPPFADVHAVIGKYRYLREQGVRTAALVYIAAPQTRHEVQTRHKPLMLAAGIQVVHEQELPLSTLSFDSAARAVANSGADYLLFVSESTQSAAMAQSMADTHYQLKFQEYVTAYASNFMDLAGPAAEGVVDWIGSLPNEEPGTTPEQANFLSWMARAAPDARPDVLAVGSWSGAKAFVDALAALPGPISRAALVAQLRSMRSYDAGGLLGPIQLGPKRSNGCYIAMKVVHGTWKRLAPARGFLC
jgi:ABC-type branched-subunit amino acid transport system substrate-binding protein